jgi:phosphohistidine phosphatase SixA
MILYLMRHAEANDKSVDPRRGITSEGRAATENMARYFFRLVGGGSPVADGESAGAAGASSANAGTAAPPQEIWHSDKFRARQTAEIMAVPLGLNEHLVEKDFLQPLDGAMSAEKMLVRFDRPLLIVGHMPFMSRLCSLLLTGNAKTETVTFATSGMVRLDSAESWQLLWTVEPADLDETPG